MKYLPSILMLAHYALCAQKIQVTVDQGTLKGTELKTFLNRTAYAFLGVPYAKPPLGDRRFKEPVYASSWMGVFDATKYPEICMQYSHIFYTTNEPVRGSEDCLYLNIYTPQIPDIPGGRLSVIVMLHGGAFTFGSGNFLGAEYLLDHNVIVVTINYRLGPLGFLSTGDDVVPGNNGLKDQLMALKWIQRNIPSFGGDPSKVTLAGLSAGGASVHYHMLSDRSRGMFRRAISMSGSALCCWAQAENMREKAKILADNLGCPTTDSYTMIKCLRKRPAIRIVAEVKNFMPWLYNPFTPFGSTVEPNGPTAFIDESPIDIILNQKANDIPWLVSFTSDEGLYPGSEVLGKDGNIIQLENHWDELLSNLLDFNFTVAKNKLPLVSQKIKEHYLHGGTINSNLRSFVKMLSDRLFLNGIEKSSKLHAKIYRSPVYSYQFNYVGHKHVSDIFMHSDIYQGVCHGDDQAYIFKALLFPGYINKDNEHMVSFMTNIWMAFVNGTDMPYDWPDLKSNLPGFIVLKINGSDPRKNEYTSMEDLGDGKFWKTLGLQENIPSNNVHEEL